MDPRNDPPRSSHSVVPMLLAAVLGGGLCVLLIVATGGYFLFVLLAVFGILGFSYVHYLLWGRAMMEEVARERAAAEAKGRLENAPSWQPEETRFRGR